MTIERATCPLDGEHWPYTAESAARTAAIRAAIAAAPCAFRDHELIAQLARFHHELGDDWPEHAYADEGEATQEHRRAAAHAFLRCYAARPRWTRSAARSVWRPTALFSLRRAGGGTSRPGLDAAHGAARFSVRSTHEPATAFGAQLHMPRTMDDRPVAGDAGYIERPRPALSRLGQEIVRQVLDQMNAQYTLNFENDTITIESPKDFFRTLDVLARQAKSSTMRLDLMRAVGEAGSEMSFKVRSSAGSIRLRLAGELADVALSIGAVKPAGDSAAIYTAGSFNDQLFLRTLASRDPDLDVA